MSNDSEFDPEIFRRAGVHTRHVTKFVPVTRATVSQWLNGRHVPTPFIRTQVLELQAAVEAAVSQSDLPVSETSLPRGRHRDRRVVAIIQKYLELVSSGEEQTTA